MLDFIKNNKKYFIISTAAILLIAVVVVLILIFSKVPSDKDDNPPRDTELQTEYVETTPTDGDEEDPENNDIIDNDGESVDSHDVPPFEGRSNGIDVSKWQGVIDWKTVKAAGIEFAIIRIGYRGENGSIYKDECAEYNLQQAHKNGILTGVYFFSTAISEDEAAEEAEWVIRFIEGYNVSYPVVYDCEGYKVPTSRMFSVDSKTRTDNALVFLKKIADEGYDTMLYGARNEISSTAYWEIDRIEKEHKIWVAQYPDVTYPDADVPEYTGKFHAWQYTNKGSVSGVSGNVDLVVCYFTKELAEPHNKDIVIKEAEKPNADIFDTYTEVDEQVTAKSLTNLRKEPTTKSDIVASIKNGEFVRRTGIGNKGWSRLEYNGETVYAITSYLTTEIIPDEPEDEKDEVFGIVFLPHEDNVTAKIEVNLRSLPSTVSGEVVGVLKSGTFLKRTAISNQGWSRLEYNGQTVYAVSSYLSNEVIEQSTEPPIDIRDDFEPTDEMVTAKIETNLRDMPTTEGSQVVYKLTNGEYVKRIGINKATGWSKLEYNGQIVYAVSSYLLVQE